MHQNCANFCARNHQSSAFKLHSSMIKLKSYILHFVVKDPVQCIYICSSSSCIEHVPIHHLYDDLVVESLYGSSTLYYRGRGEIQASHKCKTAIAAFFLSFSKEVLWRKSWTRSSYAIVLSSPKCEKARWYKNAQIADIQKSSNQPRPAVVPRSGSRIIRECFNCARLAQRNNCNFLCPNLKNTF